MADEKSTTTPTAAELAAVLAYDPETGLFTWKCDRPGGVKAGTTAGTVNRINGYRCIGIKGRDYYAHRLAWLFSSGDWPSGRIDHINGDKADNRLCNLRNANHSLNAQNLRRAHRDTVTGLLGAYRARGRYESRLSVNGKTHHLGYFDSPDEAHAAYIEAKRRLHPGCTI